MPRTVSWLGNVPFIRKTISGSVQSHWGRKELEDLFGLSSRAAGLLMDLLPKVPGQGGAHLVETAALLDFLGEVSAADNPAELLEQKRNEFRGKVDRRRKIKAFRRDDGLLMPAAPDRPDAIVFSRGKVEINFSSSIDFMEAMLHAVLRLHDDPEKFEREYCVRELDGAAAAVKSEVSELLRCTEQQFADWIATKRASRGSTQGSKSQQAQNPADFEVCGPIEANPSLSAIDFEQPEMPDLSDKSGILLSQIHAA